MRRLILVLALTACSSGPPEQEAFQLERNTEFDGSTLRFFVTLDDASVASVNTDDDAIEVLPGATPMAHTSANVFRAGSA